ncbi:PAS domain-containing protein [Gramella sp. AN32]|uniref:histidine kinase n=1 Tax=Christiangramia antarctica TaxID=2058158 RepID=A0ABW5X8G4_9FLAO|nr:PAS domain-containing protein [Gramella sp. AN32]MCM4156453.1 hypothetical protein [Gramella sp. AN32]
MENDLPIKNNKELTDQLLMANNELKHQGQLLENEISLHKDTLENLQETTDKLKITQREKKSLFDSEKRFRFLLESTTTITYTCEAEVPYGAIFISENVNKLTGYTPKDYIQDPNFWASNIHPDDKERVISGLSKLFTEGHHKHEYRWKYKNGEYHWMSDELHLIYNEQGKPIEMVGNWIDISEVKEGEAKISEVNRKLSLAVRAGGVGIWQYDLVTNEMKWDDQMYNIYGLTPGTFDNVYELWQQGLHPEDRARCNDDVNVAMLGNKNINTEFRIIWPDKSVHHIRRLAIIERDKVGKPITMIGTNWDITKIKQKEDSLQLNIKEVSDYKHALDESAIVAITDQKGIIKSVNDNFCKISKYSREELIGQDHRIINSGFHTKEFIRDLWTTIAGGNVWKGELKNKAKDCSIYWVDTTIVPFLNEQSKPYQYLVIREDITKKKQLEDQIKQFNIELEQKIEVRTQELTESEDRFRNLFANAPESSLVLDLITFKFEKVNKNAIKLFKYSAKEFIEKGPVDISPKFQPDGSLSEEKAKRYIEKAMQGERVSFEWMHCDANKKNISCEVHLASMPESKTPTIYASIVDITERKEIREKIKEQYKKLAFQNEEKQKRAEELIIANKELAFQNGEKQKRAEELIIANKELAFQNHETEIRAEELNITNKELQKTNHELDRFVYSASHDLRSPLKSLLGLSDLIKEDMDQDNIIQLEQMDMMKKSILKLDNFIEDILLYSSNARTEVELEEMNFKEIFQGILKKHEYLDGAKEIKLEGDISQDRKFISDKKRIIVVLNNLLVNALKYKDPSKVNQVVTVTIKYNKDKATICVKDNGIGIGPKDKEKIFEMFYRATKVSKGSGLGLYIVKETLDKLKGTIKVESELGEGTRFIVSIPNQLPVLN